MTFFFNIENLVGESKCNDFRLIVLLEDYYNVVTHKRLPKYKYKSLTGKSWLLNPTPLFNKSVADVSYIAAYIKLAARRDYFLYSTYNVISLDTSFYPDLSLDNLKRNPLLKVVNKQIQFKFEEKYLTRKLNGT